MKVKSAPPKKEVINRSRRFKEFNRENKTATKTLNKFKIVPRIGTCDAGVSSSKFRSSCLPFIIKQTTLPVFVAPLESNYGWLEFFPWSHGIRDNESQLYFTAGCNQTSRLDKYILYNYGHIIKLNKQHNKTMIWSGADLTGADLNWGQFCLGPIWPASHISQGFQYFSSEPVLH